MADQLIPKQNKNSLNTKKKNFRFLWYQVSVSLEQRIWVTKVKTSKRWEDEVYLENERRSNWIQQWICEGVGMTLWKFDGVLILMLKIA